MKGGAVHIRAGWVVMLAMRTATAAVGEITVVFEETSAGYDFYLTNLVLTRADG